MTSKPQLVANDRSSAPLLVRDAATICPFSARDCNTRPFYTTYESLLRDLRILFNDRKSILMEPEIRALEGLSTLDQLPYVSPSDFIGRPDGFVIDGKFKAIELNAGGSIGGIQAIASLQRKYKQLVGPGYWLGDTVDELSEYLKQYNGCNPIVAHRLLGEFPRYESQNFDLERDLQARGLNYRFMDTIELMNQISAGSITPSLIIRRQQTDVGERADQAVKELESLANRRGLRILAPQNEAVIYSSKMALAFHNEYFNDRYSVFSRWLGNCETQRLGKFQERTAELSSNKDRYVLKRDSSCLGEHVRFGDEMTSGKWNALLDSAINEGNWIYQTVERGARLTPIGNHALGSDGFEGHGVVSPFVFGKSIAGVAVRFQLNSSKKLCVMPDNSETQISVLAFDFDAADVRQC